MRKPDDVQICVQTDVLCRGVRYGCYKIELRSIAKGICAALPIVISGQAWAQDGPSEADARGSAETEESKSVEKSEEAIEVTVVGRRPITPDRTHETTVIDGQNLRWSPRVTAFEAISQFDSVVYVPGRGTMHGVGNGATGGMRMRGLGGSPNSQVLVVEDGVPDYHGVFGHPIPDAYSPFFVEDLVLVKGGDSVLYGTNALGGVVVLRSRWRDLEGYEIETDSAYGSYSTHRQSATALARFGSWDLAGGVSAMSSNGHRRGAGGDQLIGVAAVRRSIGRDTTVTIRNKVVHLVGADPGPATHPNPDNWFDVWRDNASMQFITTGGAGQFSFTPYFNIGVHRLYDGFRSTDYVGGANSSFEVKLHRTSELLMGVAGEHVDGAVDNRITGERPDVNGFWDASFYNQLTLRPLSRLSFVLGSREYYSSNYGFVFLYKGGARVSIVDGLSVHGRVARNYRQPTIRELYLPFPVANPDLRPEYSTNSSIGARYSSGHLELSCSGYRTEARDLIKYFGVWPNAEVLNIGHVLIWGVDGSIAVRDIGPISVFASADWQDVGQHTRQNPAAKFNFAIDVGKEYGAHAFRGSVGGEWVHGLYMGDYSRDPIADVFVMDLSLRYRCSWLDRGLALEPYVFLRNLMDRRYAYVRGYPMPGFNVLAGLKVEI